MREREREREKRVGEERQRKRERSVGRTSSSQKHTGSSRRVGDSVATIVVVVVIE